MDKRAEILAKLEEWERLAEGATPGPWSWSPQRGKKGHSIMAQVWDDYGDSLATLDATEDNETSSGLADFIAFSRTLIPLLLRAVRGETTLHEEVGGPDGHCGYCGEDGHGSPTDWPCPTIVRLHGNVIGDME